MPKMAKKCFKWGDRLDAIKLIGFKVDFLETTKMS